MHTHITLILTRAEDPHRQRRSFLLSFLFLPLSIFAPDRTGILALKEKASSVRLACPAKGPMLLITHRPGNADLGLTVGRCGAVQSLVRLDSRSGMSGGFPPGVPTFFSPPT